MAGGPGGFGGLILNLGSAFWTGFATSTITGGGLTVAGGFPAMPGGGGFNFGIAAGTTFPIATPVGGVLTGGGVAGGFGFGLAFSVVSVAAGFGESGHLRQIFGDRTESCLGDAGGAIASVGSGGVKVFGGPIGDGFGSTTISASCFGAGCGSREGYVREF